MAWYVLLTIGFLIGLCLSNAFIRHHSLTLVIWVFKAISIVANSIIWTCEYLQDRFGDIDIPVKLPDAKKEQPKTTKFDFNTATDEQIRKYIQKHPDEVKIKYRGGE